MAGSPRSLHSVNTHDSTIQKNTMTVSLLNCFSEVKKKNVLYWQPKNLLLLSRFSELESIKKQQSEYPVTMTVVDFSENIWYILQENSIFNTWKLNNLSGTFFKSTEISEFSSNMHSICNSWSQCLRYI